METTTVMAPGKMWAPLASRLAATRSNHRTTGPRRIAAGAQ